MSRAPQKQERGAGRRLALSVRVAEAFDSKEKTTMSIDELIKLAKSNGYGALCMRASQAGIHSPRSLIAEMRHKIDKAGLVVSMVTGDFAVPSNNDQGPEGLRHITPYLDLAQAFGADLIRVCMKKEEDISWARKAADEARERKMRLAHQSHCASLFETVNGSLQTLRAVGRPNFGIIYEPANWMIAREEYGPETIKKLQPFLFNAYVQNHRLARDGKTSVMTWKLGAVPLDHIGLWEKGGVDFDAVIAGLDAIHYRGFVTVHQAFAGIMAVDEAARKSAEYLKTFRPKS
jgi:sugar phosphate isomerase/epimerase